MRPFDLQGLRTYELQSRPSKVFHTDLGRPGSPATSIGDWLDTLPKQLAANELRKLRDHIVRAHSDGRTIAVALGGHVIKTGCAPYLIDLIERGVITAIAMNGSAAIHDLELAIAQNPSLQGKEQAFKAYANKPTHRGAPISVLMDGFKGAATTQPMNTPTPATPPSIEQPNGGPRGSEQPKQISADDLKTLRETDERAYQEYIRTHDIDIDQLLA